MLFNAKILSKYKLNSFGEELGKAKYFYFDDQSTIILPGKPPKFQLKKRLEVRKQTLVLLKLLSNTKK